MRVLLTTMNREHSVEAEISAVPRIGERVHVSGTGDREWGAFRDGGWWEVRLVAHEVKRMVGDAIRYEARVQLGVRPAPTPWEQPKRIRRKPRIRRLADSKQTGEKNAESD